jgi:hypothetical protein
MNDITIPEADIRENLEYWLKRKVTDEELKNFVQYVKNDVWQFLTDNSKSFMRDREIKID